ncbi:MAG: hypothetical protein V1797_09635 [Pseudomonadota bacterium]
MQSLIIPAGLLNPSLGGAFKQVEAGYTSLAFTNGVGSAYIALAQQYDLTRHFIELLTAGNLYAASLSYAVTGHALWLDPANPRAVFRYRGNGSFSREVQWRLVKTPANLKVRQGCASVVWPAGGNDQIFDVPLSPAVDPAKAHVLPNVANGSLSDSTNTASCYGISWQLLDANTLRIKCHHTTGGPGYTFAIPWTIIYGG